MHIQSGAIRRRIALPAGAILAASLVLALHSAPSRAQNAAQPQWLSVYILHVKPDRVGEFESLARQMTAAEAKAKAPQAQVYQVVAGEGSVYHVVVPIASLSTLDQPVPPMGPAEMTLWQERVTNTIDSSKHFFARIISQTTSANAPTPKLMMLRTVTVVSGKQDEFISWVEKDLGPAAKNANLGQTFVQGAFGDSQRHFYFASGIANWAEFDKPNALEAAIGQKAFRTLIDKLDGIVEESEITIVQPRTDLMAQQ
jgi:hypothetical protein